MAEVFRAPGSRPIAVAALILLLSAVAGCEQIGDDGCSGSTVYHPPAGTCILQDALVVDGERDQVEAAVASHDGQILASSVHIQSHTVRFPVETLDELDRIKGALSAAGLSVRYAMVLELYGDP